MKPSLVHSIIRSRGLPRGYDFVFDLKRSKGSQIVDSLTGRKYIDMFSFYGSCPVGYNHPKMKSFSKEIGTIAIHNPSNSNVYTEEYAKFVQALGTVIPSEFKYNFFINGGALAVENAIKAAFDWKMRTNEKYTRKAHENDLSVIHFTNAFHGRSGYTMSMTNTDYWKTAYYPKFNWPRVSMDDSCIADITRIIKDQPANIAAILVEPIQGEGGDNHVTPKLWQSLYNITRDNNIMLIADEVQSGMGLTGKPWAYQWLGSSPDILVFGKKTQVCGFAATDRIDSVTDHVFQKPGRLNSTWGGNLTDMMRSRKYIEVIEEENLIENAGVVGEYGLSLIQDLCRRHPILTSNPRGRGLAIAFDLVTPEACELFKQLMYEAGVVIMSCGVKTIRLRPMLDVDRATMKKVIDIMDKCLKKM